jgi:hypothetical protein
MSEVLHDPPTAVRRAKGVLAARADVEAECLADLYPGNEIDPKLLHGAVLDGKPPCCGRHAMLILVSRARTRRSVASAISGIFEIILIFLDNTQ